MIITQKEKSQETIVSKIEIKLHFPYIVPAHYEHCTAAYYIIPVYNTTVHKKQMLLPLWDTNMSRMWEWDSSPERLLPDHSGPARVFCKAFYMYRILEYVIRVLSYPNRLMLGWNKAKVKQLMKDRIDHVKKLMKKTQGIW